MAEWLALAMKSEVLFQSLCFTFCPLRGFFWAFKKHVAGVDHAIGGLSESSVLSRESGGLHGGAAGSRLCISRQTSADGPGAAGRSRASPLGSWLQRDFVTVNEDSASDGVNP